MKPILFNTEMVRAILEGRKTQTRRLCKGQPQDGVTSPEKMGYEPPYKPGDVLYVRETWCNVNTKEYPSYFYKADNDRPIDFNLTPWRPSIHMPREAARLFLMVKDVRIERLQDIKPLDVKAEGIEITCYEDEYDVEMSDEAMERLMFSMLWDKTIKPADSLCYGWLANPWVWVIEFERLDEKPAGLWADRDTAQFGDQDVLMPAT